MEIALTMIQAYNKLGYRAYNVTSHDFAGGPNNVRRLANMAEFPFVSANIVDSMTQKPIFKPYIIEKVGGKKFGIIGVTASNNVQIKGLTIADIGKSIQSYLPEIRRKADFVILMAYLQRDDEIKLFAEQIDVDFILTSGTFRYSRNLNKKNGMLIARCGNIGKYIGAITFDLQDENRELTDISNVQIQLQYAEKRLNSFASAADGKPLEEFYADEPGILRTIKSLQTQIQVLNSEATSVVNPITYNLIELDKSVPDDPAIRSMLKKLGKRLSAIQP